MSESAPSDRLLQVGGSADEIVYYNERRESYHTWFDYEAYEPVTTAILMAVASIRDIDPVDLEPLHACVDPDALNELFDHWCRNKPRSGGGTVSFSYADCDVTVQSDGEIIIERQRNLLGRR